MQISIMCGTNLGTYTTYADHLLHFQGLCAAVKRYGKAGTCVERRSMAESGEGRGTSHDERSWGCHTGVPVSFGNQAIRLSLKAHAGKTPRIL